MEAIPRAAEYKGEGRRRGSDRRRNDEQCRKVGRSSSKTTSQES